jgi:hypothetical protein
MKATQEWVFKELETLEIGDKRRKDRCALLLERLADNPSASLVAACRGWAETMAAYRFLGNEAVDNEKILEPHRNATQERIAAHPVVLIAQDTTEFDYHHLSATQGLGPLNYDEREGFYAHLSVAITPERLCLGTVGAKMWAREASRKKVSPRKLPIEAKESVRWLEGYGLACEVAGKAPQTRVVSVCDREADIYELFLEPEERRRTGQPCANWIVRAHENRRLNDEEAPTVRLREKLAEAPILALFDLELPRTPKRSARVARVEVRALDGFSLRAPWRPDQRLESARLNAVWLREIGAPTPQEAVDWLLLSDLPVGCAQEALQVAHYYSCRWQIEVFFRTLKSGCRVERLQLGHVSSLQRCIALYLIVTWRVLYLMGLGRTCPDVCCTLVFEDAEWKSVWCVTQKTQAVPRQPPKLGTMVSLLASLGGYLNRKGEGPPGAQTIWIGLQHMMHLTEAWLAFGPETTKNCV